MVAWSVLFRSSSKALLSKNLIVPKTINNGITSRLMSAHRIMEIQPSRWHWNKTKDLFHLYFMVGMIPIGLVVLYTNIFIGHAQLAPIPDDYRPEEWEYFKSPITRFFAKYVYTTDQQEYEKYCHFLWTEQEVMKLRALEKKVKALMADRKDYQAWYYVPYVSGNYSRRQAQKERDSISMYSSGAN